MFRDNASVNQEWLTIKNNIEKIGKDGLTIRQNDIKWHLAENGVTYNVYGDGGTQNRLWDLDPLPLLISAEEWKSLEPKIVQRAQLLDFILKDLYTDRTLIKNGLIPAEIVFANKNFIRQCDKIKYSTSKNLLVYGADLARGPDGNMWVINDKTGAPSGMGYALENRLTIGRSASDLYDGMHVKRLSNFFEEYKEFLNVTCPKNKDNPFIVLLTPGPHNETYFEHAYLSSYLGYPLVQGSDLVVRDGFLWLKSLKGLKVVDVVIRRVDDDYCDPLELKNDSKLGVAGLLSVVRKGNVTVVNPVGSTVLENPALLPFLPAISKAVLGEDLALHQVATWWCGQPQELKFVLENLSKLIIKRIDAKSLKSTIICSKLSDFELSRLSYDISKNPQMYVGQEMVSFSTAPTWTKDKIVPRNTLWRTFAIAKNDSYKVMPGGLVRVAAENELTCISNQSGSGSKDVWILSDDQDEETKIFKKMVPTKNIIANLDDLPSLTAENLFWIGRYSARALFTARYLRTLIRLISDANHYELQTNEQCQTILSVALTHITMTYPGFLDSNTDKSFNANNEILSIIFDKQRVGSLAHTLWMLKNANIAVKNLWSNDAWRVFDKIVKNFEHYEKDSHTNLRLALHYLDGLIMRLIAFMGLVGESIVKEQGLILYLIGSNLEESLLNISATRAILISKQNQHVEYELLEAYLNSFESLNSYRYSYKSHLEFESVANMITFNSKYPKSLVYKMYKLIKFCEQLPKRNQIMGLNAYEKYVFESYSKLKLADLETIFDDKMGLKKDFEKLLSEVSGLLIQASNSISQTFFNHN